MEFSTQGRQDKKWTAKVMILEVGKELAVTVWDSNQLNYVPTRQINDLP